MINVSIFEEEDELQKLERERQAKLDELQKTQEREQELSKILYELRNKRTDLQIEANKIRVKIEEVNKSKLLELEKQREIERLQAEARKLDEYVEKLNELCADFPSFSQAREYQKEDLVYCLKAFLDGKSGVLNANDMSMGKTMETVVFLYVIKKLRPEYKILWLTKKSLTLSTPKEIKRWWPEVQLLTSAIANTKEQREFVLEMIDLGADFLVANYEFIRTTNIPKGMFNVVVVDEAHKLKGGANLSGPTAIWEKAKLVCAQADFTIFLTGTPMVNRPEEMWAYLHIFDPVRFKDLRSFQKNFQLYRSYSRDFGQEARASRLLQDVLRGQMFRRTTAEVGLQMPPILPDVIALEMLPEQRKVYNQMRESFYVWLDQQDDEPLTATSILAQLTRLRQINVWPGNIKFVDQESGITRTLNLEESSKIDEAMDIIDRIDGNVVLFSNFNEPLYEVQRRCKQVDVICEVLNGDNSWDVGRIENSFQQNKIQVLCMNSAVGEGLNLQKDKRWPGGASFGIMLDKWYNDARNDQCLRRIVRPGSDDRGVFYYLENEDSVDAWINELCAEKTASFDTITEAKSLRPNNWKEHLQGKI
jgi:SNF2 family DNA or RNA helicase